VIVGRDQSLYRTAPWHYTPFVVMGAVELLSQTLLLRELLVVFQGNELTIGIVLASWMASAALGALTAERLAGRLPRPRRLFILSHAANGLLLPIGVIAARTARVWAGIPAGVTMGYGAALWISLVTLLPFGLLAGAQFSFACRAGTRAGPSTAPTSQGVYILEAAGFLVAGLLFSLCLADGLQPLRVSFTVAALAMASCGLLQARAPGGRQLRARLTVAVVAAVLVAAVASPLPEIIQQRVTQWSFPGLHVVESANSRYANLVVTKEDGQASVFLNGVYVAGIPQADAFVVEPLLRFPLLLHAKARSVLALGTGLELLESAAADAGIENVYYVELDPTLLSLLARWSDQTGTAADESVNTTIHGTDIRAYLADPGPSFDVVVLHPPAPTSIQLNRLYTHEFFELCRRRMNGGGILALTVPSSGTYLGQDLARLNRSVYGALAAAFSTVVPVPGDPAILLATNRASGLDLDLSTLAPRLEALGLATSLFNTRYIELRTRSSLQDWYIEMLEHVSRTAINQDANPTALRHGLILETAKVSPRWAGFLRLADWPVPWLILLAAAVIAPLALLAAKRRHGRNAAALMLGNVVVTNGMLGTSMCVILAVLFQTHFGFIYSAIALLTASFMGGLALGATAIRRVKRTWRAVSRLEIFLLAVPLAAFALVSLQVAQSAPAMRAIYEATLFLLAVMCGFLVGGEFALALRLHWKECPGKPYALDLVGAAGAAIVVAALVIPTFGIAWMLAGLVALKGGSLLLLLLGLRGRQHLGL